MKKLQNLLQPMLFCCVLLLAQTSKAQFQNQPNAPDFDFTDLDGNTYNLYDMLDEGYVVLFMCGENVVCWQHESIVAALNPSWELYGPEGDNSMKIFFVDTDSIASESTLAFWQNVQETTPGEVNMPVTTDSLVADYTSQYNLLCPIVNYDGQVPGYLIDGGPSYFMICPDKVYHHFTGFGELNGVSVIGTHKDACFADLNSDVGIMSIESEPDYCVFEEEDNIEQVSLELTFNIKLATPFNSTDTMITELYQVEVYINGEYLETQDKDPLSDGQLSFYDVVKMNSIIVNPGDTVRFELQYPNDSYQGNNTLEFVVPIDINQTQTANSNDLTLHYNAVELPTPNPNFPLDETPGAFYFSIKKGEQVLYNFISNVDGEPYSINLQDGNCYKIRFTNQQKFGPELVDANNNTLLQLSPFAYFPSGFTPWLFFNVDADGDGNVSVSEQKFDKKTKKLEYFDLLGKRVADSFSELPTGVFIVLRHFEDGSVSTTKVLKHNL